MADIPLYIHIPFCTDKCRYCDFYSLRYNCDLAGRYINALTNQIRIIKQQGVEFSSVYIGGGTPSVLSLSMLKQLLGCIRPRPTAEFTVEANPESLDQDKLKLLADFGANRLSIGIQSFYDDILSFLGRLHTKQEALKSVSLASRFGFDNLSIDLIYGVPGKDFSRWQEELRILKGLPLKHVSLYSLTYNRDTPLFLDLEKGRFVPVPSEEEADMYLYAVDFLEKSKMNQYEVSNFAFAGFESKHNLSYWSNNPYIGLGPGAVSYIAGERRRYKHDIILYIDKINTTDEQDTWQEIEKLSSLDRAKETAALNIRRSKGIDLEEFRKKTGFNFWKIEKEAVSKLAEEGLVVLEEDSVKLTKRGFLLCDYVCREFI